MGQVTLGDSRHHAVIVLAVALMVLVACDGSSRARLHPIATPSPSPLRSHTIYRAGKMDRIAHFMSKYWDGGAGDPLDVYNLELTHSSATGCRFGAFHAFHDEGDLASPDVRHDARVQLHSSGAEVVGFGQYHGDWWAVAEDCA